MTTAAAARPRRRAAAGGAVVTVVVVAGVAVAVTRPFARHESPGAAAYATSTAPVARRSLTARTAVDATLGYAGTYQVFGQAAGTITALPPIGRIIRQGRVLYRVSGRPVILLYGPVPAYRDLSYGMTGRDVAELNAALVALGHAPGLDAHSHRFGAQTYRALERLQRRTGLPRTGVLSLGQAVFLPGAARVTGHGEAVPGGPARPGATVLSATSTRPVVSVGLDAAQQTEVRAGDRVVITLPDGRTTPGVVSSVGRVAHAAARGAADQTPTVTVKVTPSDPKATGGLDRAPVQVSIVTGSVRDALVVPVSALLARPGGGYAVEVAARPRNRLVAVSPGLFDDADGLVQVTGSLAPGQRVVVPTT